MTPETKARLEAMIKFYKEMQTEYVDLARETGNNPSMFAIAKVYELVSREVADVVAADAVEAREGIPAGNPHFME